VPAHDSIITDSIWERSVPRKDEARWITVADKGRISLILSSLCGFTVLCYLTFASAPHIQDGSITWAQVWSKPYTSPGRVMWDLWWTKWRWGRFSPSTSVSPANLHSTNCSTITLIYHPRLVQQAKVAAVPSGLSPTPLIIKKEKLQKI
jgi:hypothetical protein